MKGATRNTAPTVQPCPECGRKVMPGRTCGWHRRGKPLKALAVRIEAQIFDALVRVCHDQGYSQTGAVERAITDWLLEHDEDYGRVGLDPAMEAS